MSKSRSIFEKSVRDAIDLKEEILKTPRILSQLDQISQILITTFQNRKTVYFCGNGGSAADAQHLAAEFTGKYYHDRPPLAAEALHVNSSFMTAVSNDYEFEETYSRLIEGIGKSGDVLIALSTSGLSTNVVRAVIKASELGMQTISLTGECGGDLIGVSDLTICIPSNDTPRIQECQMLIGHILCQVVEQTLFPHH